MKSKTTNKIPASAFAILALILFGSTSIIASPGALDLTFSGDGKLTDVTGRVNAVAIQSDGNIVVVGEINESFAVARYNPDGSPDIGFGVDGKVITQIESIISYAKSVTIQSDGKIVAAGLSYGGGFFYFTVVRYNTNGSLDSSFDGDGIVKTVMLSDNYAEDVAIQPDGKIIVAGCTNTLYDFDCDHFALARYNIDGSLDTTFDSDGKVLTPFGIFNQAYLYSIALQPDGKIVAAGYSRNGTTNDFTVVRYNIDGSLDQTFDSDGKAFTPIGSGDDRAYSVSIQPDWKLVVAGYSSNGSDDDFALARYNANGSLDATFDSDGKVLTAIGSGADVAHSVEIQTNGKIVAAGYSFNGTNNDFALARYDTNGSLDTTFGGGDGKSTADFDVTNDIAHGLTLDRAGRAVVVGESAGRMAIARFQLGPDLRRNGKIAFTSDRDGNPEIYVMNSDGTGQTRLTTNSVVDDHAMWSPDSTRLAFISQRAAGGFAIFQMNTDGTNKVEITPLSQFVNVPPTGSVGFSMSWSPDGRKITFQDPYYNDIWVVDIESHSRQNLTNDGGGQIALFDYNPVWSPDGSTILYASPRFNGICPALYAIHPDGTNRRLIVPCQAYSPSWSPDGSKIAFVDLVDDFASKLFIANSDGTNIQTFDGGYPDPGYRDYARWSSDGKTIAFNKTNLSDIEIYVKKIDGEGSSQLTNTEGRNYRPSWQPLAKTTFDFDGDGRSDISVFRPSDRTWYLQRSTAGFSATQFGLASDTITPADFDGDGLTDIAVYREGVWYWLDSTSSSFRTTQFGLTGDVPVAADFTGDGRAELSIYRGGTWWSLDLTNNQTSTVQFGLPADRPVVGDFDGDGRTDKSIYRNGEWHLNRSSLGYTVVNFGLASDKIVPADYDGDGKTDQAVYRDGTWYLLRSTNGFMAFRFGIASDIPVPADYDGDGRADAAVFRNGTWYIAQSSNGAVTYQQFGLSSDIPVAGASQ